MNSPRVKLYFLLGAVVLTACWSYTPRSVSDLGDKQAALEGRELVHGMAACGFCHGAQPKPGSELSGGQLWHDKFGEVIAPNLTSSEKALGKWSGTEISNAIRFSVGPNDRALSKEAHAGFAWLDEDDLIAIVTYLRTLKPVDQRHERRSLSFMDRNIDGFFDSWKTVDNYVPSIKNKDVRAYGRYIVNNLAQCATCHNSPDTLFSTGMYLGGGKVIKRGDNEAIVPGILNTEVDGLGNWSEEDIVFYLKTGRTPEGRTMNPLYCPVEFYANARPEELEAVAKYLKSLN